MGAFPNAIAFGNGKGGVGKTSAVSNVGGSVVLDDRWAPVLLVDLDKQGSIGADLGYKQQGRSDEGAGLLHAVLSGGTPNVLRDVRPGLDVIPGGRKIEELEAILRVHDRPYMGVAQALEPIADNYNLILIDTPPSGGPLVEAALVAARHMIIPTRADAESIAGLVRIGESFQQVVTSGYNPDLEVLGIILFAMGASSRRLRRTIQDTLAERLGDIAPVFTTVIRHAEVASVHMREHGLLAYEYEQAGVQAASARQLAATTTQFSRAAQGLAGDYQQLTSEILAEYLRRAQVGAGT